MLELEDKLIELLKNGVSFSVLKTKMGLCSSELARRMNRLENKGIIVNKTFNQQGVKFKIGDSPTKQLKDNVQISSGGKFQFLVLADTHLGNVYENINLVNKLYEYAENNNIRYVFHLGDIIEGYALKNYDNARFKRIDIYEQINYVTRYYPKSDNITTLYILGNHDYRSVTKGIDISKVIEKRRLDMHFLGYKNSKLIIENRNILLHHPFTIERENKYDKEIKELYMDEDFDLILRGHTHHNGIYINDMNSVVVNVPACYDSPNRKYIGAYDVTIKENEVGLNSLIIDDEVTTFSVLKYPLNPKQLIKRK